MWKCFALTTTKPPSTSKFYEDLKNVSLKGQKIETHNVFFTVFPANPGGIVGSFIHEFVFCEWAKAVIFNHFSFKTSAIFSISWGKVIFVIQTKNLKGESSKSARKTVKQNRRLVMSPHQLYKLYAVSTAILLLWTVYSTFLLCL